MAKYGRFDPKNKNRSKDKYRSEKFSASGEDVSKKRIKIRPDQLKNLQDKYNVKM